MLGHEMDTHPDSCLGGISGLPRPVVCPQCVLACGPVHSGLGFILGEMAGTREEKLAR